MGSDPVAAQRALTPPPLTGATNASTVGAPKVSLARLDGGRDLNGNPVKAPGAPIPELPRSGEWKRSLPTALGARLGSGRE